MLQRVVRLVATVVQEVAVVAAPEQELPTLPSWVIVARDAVRRRGPLQGLAAGLASLPVHVELAYATATDVPFLHTGWIRRLTELIGANDIAIPHCEGYHHPLAALYRRATVLPVIEALLSADRLGPVFLIDALPTRIVSEEELRVVDPRLGTLRNLNTPEDYHSALEEAGLDATEQPRPTTRVDRPRASLSRLQ
jgi:molybdopterin-guanine dinucleotide biosynthesis protein A